MLAVLAIFAVWANRQLLDTDSWAHTSSRLLEDRHIREQVAAFLADQLYENVNVQGEIEAALPEQIKPLAGPAAGGLKELAQRGAEELLKRPQVQELWQGANRQAHIAFLAIVENRSNVITTGGGNVTLDLRELLGQVASRVGLAEGLKDKIPPDAAQIRILKSDELDLAQEIVRTLKRLVVVLVLATLFLFTLAVALAHGWRREAVRAIGVGFAVAGVAVLILRALAGGIVVDELASTDAVRPSADATWRIATTLLTEAATATIAYGIFIVFAAWLAGPTRVAVVARRWLAPWLREPAVAFGGVTVFVILLLIWGPTEGLRQVLPALFMAVLLFVGMEVLRRQLQREHPDADMDSTRRALGDRLSDLGGQAKDGASGLTSGLMARARATGSDDRLERLERLAALRASGALDDAEFTREKARILGGSKPSEGPTAIDEPATAAAPTPAEEGEP